MYQFYNATQVSGQMSETFTPAVAVEVFEIKLNCSERMTPTNAITIQLDSGQGSIYDATILDNYSISGEISYVVGYIPPKVMRTDDSLIVTTGDASEELTYGLEIVYKEI